MANDVLHFHDSVVDQDPDHKRQSEKTHIVESEAEGFHDQKSGDHGKRHRRGRDGGRPKVFQGDPNHNHGQKSAQEKMFNTREIGLLHKASASPHSLDRCVRGELL